MQDVILRDWRQEDWDPRHRPVLACLLLLIRSIAIKRPRRAGVLWVIAEHLQIPLGTVKTRSPRQSPVTMSTRHARAVSTTHKPHCPDAGKSARPQALTSA